MVDVQIAITKLEEFAKSLPKPAQDKLQELADTTKQPKGVLVGGAAALAILLFLLLCPALLMIDLAGAIYPAYASLMLVAGPGDPKIEDAKYWLSYWTIFALFRMLTHSLDFLVRSFLVRCILCVVLIYLYLPATRGVDLITEKVLKPFVFPQLTGVAYVEKKDESKPKEASENKEMDAHIATILTGEAAKKKE
eukprot:gnl/TRDRNA2_/TRDRNA2_157815_c0_seq1.p1 gnl/TRDRNA2_/TRDRNA2_157815_c0~~gnl/TRDRNA2_/TRDRNA2_157815_c0_seq1.p1  ORF type:complete len:219 (+),score=46.89 gnl/TRDRNA2_/TRDRNA2_157815_c0_seq1:76-657(+)